MPSLSGPLGSTLALLLVTAGCLGAISSGDPTGATVDDPFPTDWARAALVQGSDHDHADAAHHANLSTSNFELVGYDPLITDHHGRTSGDYLCSSNEEADGRRLTIVHSWGSDVAFVLVDVTDPKDPRKVGELVMRNTNAYDVDLSPDLEHVVIGTSAFDSGPDTPASTTQDLAGEDGPPKLVYRSACTDQDQVLPLPPDAGYTSGAVLVDITDPASPEIVDYKPLPLLGAHSIQVHPVEDREIVIATVLDFNAATSYYELLEITDGPNGAQLMPLSVYQHDVAGSPQANGHDGTIQQHPVTGDWLAYLAYGSNGMILIDIDDPSSPELVSQWTDWHGAGDETTNYGHTVWPMEDLVEGRHVTFIGEECGSPPPGAPSCQISAVDTTDPANPQTLGGWTLPHRVQWEYGLQWSLHYAAPQNGTLFMGAYHAGLWAIDISSIDAMTGDMQSIGVYLPTEESPRPAQGDRSAGADALLTALDTRMDATPIVLEPRPNSDGTITITDVTSGLYTVRFDDSDPAPARAWDFDDG